MVIMRRYFVLCWCVLVCVRVWCQGGEGGDCAEAYSTLYISVAPGKKRYRKRAPQNRIQLYFRQLQNVYSLDSVNSISSFVMSKTPQIRPTLKIVYSAKAQQSISIGIWWVYVF